MLNNIFGNFELAQKINSHNGPCFRTGKFRSFCNQLKIVNITSSPYHNLRVVGTTEKILKKNTGDTDITKALTTYLHTLVSDTLPSPAELFLNSRINTSFSMIITPVPLNDQQKTHLRWQALRIKKLKLSSRKATSTCPANPSGSLMTVRMSGHQDTSSPKMPHRIHNRSSTTRTTEGSDEIKQT